LPLPPPSSRSRTAGARYQEQKHGGKEQATVQTKDGNKYSLPWIVHNTYDAWMTVLGQPRIPLGDFS
jgi:hypothetical protein